MNSLVVPYAGDIHFWHTGTGKENWIQKVADRFPGRPAGYYLVGADGTVYAMINDLLRGERIDGIDDEFDWNLIFVEGMKRFRETPPKPIELTDQELKVQPHEGPEKTTSVVRVYSRLKANRGWQPGIGLSHLWIFQDEVRQMLSLKAETQNALRLPSALIARLVTAHLVDHQAGDSLVWTADEVRRCDFRAYLVKDEGSTRTIGFEGDFLMEASGESTLAITGQLIGEFTLNKDSNRVERFRAYFQGEEKGTVDAKRGDVWDPNHAQRGPAPLYLAMVETKDDDRTARSVAPVLRTSLKDYRVPKMNAAFYERYGR